MTARENLTGIRVIRAFCKEDEELARFRQKNEELTRMQKKSGSISGLTNPLTYVIINFAIIVLIWTGALQVQKGILTQGQVVALYNYMSQILVELIKLANLIVTINKALASANRISDVFDIHSSMEWQEKETEAEVTDPENAVVFDHVSLAYHADSEAAISDVSFTAKKGEIIGIIGGTGSGKSSLVNEILYKELARKLNRARFVPGKHDCVEGLAQLDKVINIDQSPIGRTPRSNPATYTGVFDMIRDLFASTPEAKARGYKKGRFSFNVKGGRCEACQGDGIIKIEMNFLPDIYVPCEVCNGKRYNRETLDVKYKGKSIFEVLDMTVEEALGFFEPIPSIYRKIKTLYDVGLSYVKLGQPSTTLSGGEAQRIKLATELSRRSTGKTVYVLDEPTTGLHFADVHKLIDILHRLAEGGNTVIVIEHNLDVIKTADYIIDIGPEGGDRGGTVIAQGTPEEVAKMPQSYTGIYIQKMLDKARE